MIKTLEYFYCKKAFYLHSLEAIAIVIIFIRNTHVVDSSRVFIDGFFLHIVSNYSIPNKKRLIGDSNDMERDNQN